MTLVYVYEEPVLESAVQALPHDVELFYHRAQSLKEIVRSSNISIDTCRFRNTKPRSDRRTRVAIIRCRKRAESIERNKLLLDNLRLCLEADNPQNWLRFYQLVTFEAGFLHNSKTSSSLLATYREGIRDMQTWARGAIERSKL